MYSVPVKYQYRYFRVRIQLLLYVHIRAKSAAKVIQIFYICKKKVYFSDKKRIFYTFL